MKHRTIVFFFLIFLLPAVSRSAVYYVPDDYPTIQMAVDATQDGDTVLVRPGTYDQNVSIKDGHDISLISTEGPSETVICGQGLITTVTIYEGIIDGFSITNGMGDPGPDNHGCHIPCEMPVHHTLPFAPLWESHEVCHT